MTKEHLNKDGSPDMRYAENQHYSARKFRQGIVGAIVLAILVASILVGFLKHPRYANENIFEDVKPTATPTPTEAPKPRSYYEAEPLRYLRFRGQELGLDEYEITKFISLFTRCENSSLNPEAINVNSDKHRSIDVGITQINMYWHRNKVTLVDMLDPVKNIDFAYTLYLEQGLTPWTCAKKLGYI